jgi:hypothetical protein
LLLLLFLLLRSLDFVLDLEAVGDGRVCLVSYWLMVWTEFVGVRQIYFQSRW